MSKSSKRLLTISVLTLVAAFGGWRVWQAYAAKGQSQGAGAPARPGRVVTVSVTQAKKGSVREEIVISGALKPKAQVDVTSQATGRVQSISVHVGDVVRRGQRIAILEDDELQQQVRRAEAARAVVEATLAQRRAELSNAEADLERSKTLLTEGLIPKQEYEAKQTSYRVVQAQMQLTEAQERQAVAELNELKIRLSQTTIEAPMSGHIALRYVDVGALVNASAPIVRIVNLSTMITMANVPEREVGKLRVGNEATVHVSAYGEREFQGRIVRISPVLDAATRSALVEVEIPNPDAGLRAEMFARVTLDLESTREAVLVPREALVYRGDQPGVFVLQAERPVFRNVETGLTQGGQVEVLANLQAGTTVVTRGSSMIAEGDQIRIVGREEAEAEESKGLNSSPTTGAIGAVQKAELRSANQ